MNDYLFKVFKGGTNYSRTIRARSYEDARWQAGVDGFPPAYIWSIQPIIMFSGDRLKPTVLH